MHMSDGFEDTSQRAFRAAIREALKPFAGRTISADLIREMMPVLTKVALEDHMATARPHWVGVDWASDEVNEVKEKILASKGPGYFRDLFIGEFHAPTPEEILDEQWLKIMRTVGISPPALVVMRQADHKWLEVQWRAANCIADPHLPAFRWRGLPIQIDEDYDRPKVFTEAEARRQGLRW